MNPEIKLTEEEASIQQIYEEMHPRHKNFIKEYIIDFNKTRAYAKAFARKKDAISRASSSRLLTNVNIRKAIKYEIKKKFDNLDLSVEEVIKRLTMIMRSSLEGIVEWESGKIKIKDSKELTEEQKWLISEIAETKEGLKIKLVSKDKGIELLMKHFGLLTEKIEHSGDTEAKVHIYLPKKDE